MNEIVALIGSGAGSIAFIFLGGTVLTFVAGIIVALLVRHAGWAWVSGPIIALLGSGFIGWQNFRLAHAGAPHSGPGPVLNIDTAPGLPTLIFLFVVFLYLAFWIGMGTLAGREFLEYLNERRQGRFKDASDPSSSS